MPTLRSGKNYDTRHTILFTVRHCPCHVMTRQFYLKLDHISPIRETKPQMYTRLHHTYLSTTNVQSHTGHKKAFAHEILMFNYYAINRTEKSLNSDQCVQLNLEGYHIHFNFHFM